LLLGRGFLSNIFVMRGAVSHARSTKKIKGTGKKIVSMHTDVEEIDNDKFSEIVSNTWLSKRQAELYLLKNQGFNTKEAAQKIGIEKNAAYTYWSKVKDKLRKSRETVELNIS